MDKIVKEIKGVMKHHWGWCNEGGVTLALVVRSGLFEEVTSELTLRGVSQLLWDLGPVPVFPCEWVFVMRLVLGAY